MAEIFRFFNSSDSIKRTYSAEDFSSFFEEFLSTGLVHTDNQPFLNVQADGTNMQTYLTDGSAVIKGHLYKNVGSNYLTHDQSETTFDRIDRVVLRCDKRPEAKHIKAFVLKGMPSVTPQPPALTRTDDVYEISLKQVRIKANSTVVTNEDMTDERLNKDVCGLVNSLITVPVEALQQNFNEFKSQLNDEFYNWFNSVDEQIEVTDLRKEVELIKKNQIELLMQRYLEGKSGEGDRGYFYDILKDTSKIDLNNTTALIDTDNNQIKMNGSNLQEKVTWKPYPIGFVANKVKHYHTRPVGKLIKVTEDALSGQNQIKVANVELTVTEVI